MLVRENMKAFGRRESVSQAGTDIPQLCMIAEQDSNLGRSVAAQLQEEGFRISTLPMTADTIPRLKQLGPSLVIIEAATARGPALGLCLAIRKIRIPVILLSANASEEERVLGLESGADDFVTESLGGREIGARVRAVLRRFMRQSRDGAMFYPRPPFLHPAIASSAPNMKTGDIEVDPSAMRISVRGTEVATTKLEFRLLYYLVDNQARVFSRDQLLDAVWGAQNNVELRSVDACVRRLRRKIEPDPVNPTYLQTVRGAGYRFQVPPISCRPRE
jgi:DNA-binding response OmpR family regulator